MVFFYFSEEKFPSFEDSSMLRRHLHFSNRTRKQSLPKKRDGKARQGEGEIKAGRDKRRASSKCTVAHPSAQPLTRPKSGQFSPRAYLQPPFFLLYFDCAVLFSRRPADGEATTPASRRVERKEKKVKVPPPPFSLRTIMEQHAFGGGEGEKGT